MKKISLRDSLVDSGLRSDDDIDAPPGGASTVPGKLLQLREDPNKIVRSVPVSEVAK